MMASPIWFVTGASGGFGRGIAHEALARGHQVVATARHSSRLADLKEKGAITMDLDVTQNIDEIKAIVEKAHEITSRIDILINAPGYILEGAIEETS